MSTTLDGQNLFDEQQLEIEVGSVKRDSVDRTVAGLDGVLRVDLGCRGREIKQKGALRAKSKSQMEERVNAISALLDGETHTLVTNDGESFADLWMSSFKVGKKRVSGNWVCCDYEIVYTQLVVQ